MRDLMRRTSSSRRSSGNPTEVTELLKDKFTPSDFDDIIRDLRNYIDDAPPGFQAKFARAVADLKQRKLGSIDELRQILNPLAAQDINYMLLLNNLEKVIRDSASDSHDRYDAALRLARLREDKSQTARKKSP